jgi:hypothetical protein
MGHRSILNLAVVLGHQGKYEAAEEEGREGGESRRRRIEKEEDREGGGSRKRRVEKEKDQEGGGSRRRRVGRGRVIEIMSKLMR